ncbi:MAG TPA: nitroreductase family protein [Dongiaceae bacterium]|nr:nitroreductase family protein [Dongiaceae bacterium]
MKKPAATEFPVHELIRERWSPRAFADKDVPAAELRSLFEAARWAPSSSNEQPWAFIVAQRGNQEEFERALAPIAAGNLPWVKSVPVVGYAVCELAFAKNGTPNRNAQYDTGAAMALLSLEATARGLFVHQMAGFDPETAREVYEIPVTWTPIAAFVLGYGGEAASLPEPYRDREGLPRTRKPLREFVMSGKWGHTAEFLEK